MLILAAALIGTAGLTTAFAAASSPTDGLTSSVLNQAAPAAGTFTGTVTQNGPTLIVHAKDGDHQLTVAPGAPVLRNGKTTTVDKLKKGDKITATLNAQGVATRLDAQSGSSAGQVLVWLIPLLIVVALVLLALWWYLGPRRRHRESLHGRIMHA
jgi:hypothetical protein